MKLESKTLWAVDLHSLRDAQAFVRNARSAGVSAVCLRTMTPQLSALIPEFHRLGIDVYGWRWPAVEPQPRSDNHYYARDEAAHVVKSLIPAGLDGYIVDPESDAAGDDNDWNKASLAPLAKEFCSAIRARAIWTGRSFLFGTTSGCIYPSPEGKPDIPWAQFFEASSVLVPQTYWRRQRPRGDILAINGGSPDRAVARGMQAWLPKAGGRQIAPMAGELGVVTPDEIAGFGAALDALQIRHAHFYSGSPHVDPAILDAIRAL